MNGSGQKPAAVVLGGGANSLSVARSLGRAGVKVYAITGASEHVRYSRYATWIDVPKAGEQEETWAQYLLGPQSDWLRGSVLLACSDAALLVIAHNRERLVARFILDDSNPEAQLCMLNKLATYRAAREAGVPTPRFWIAGSREQIEAVRDELVFPLLVKPLISHLFERRFGRKFLVASSLSELREAFDRVEGERIETMLVELIPGGDNLLCSYYTYLDERGEPLFDFTKRIIRRYPVGMGSGSYHVTDRVDGVKELGLRLWRHVGLRGVANVEFKLDTRDRQLKLIECNARYTNANCLVAASGIDLALFVYNRLTGRPLPHMDRFRSGVRLWSPQEDYFSFRELQRRGELTFGGWARGLMHRQTMLCWRWYDPMPTMKKEWERASGALTRRLKRSRPAPPAPPAEEREEQRRAA